MYKRKRMESISFEDLLKIGGDATGLMETISIKGGDDSDDGDNSDDGYSSDGSNDDIQGGSQPLTFKEILENYKKKPTTELKINAFCEGFLDFAPIQKFPQCRKIVFEKPGKITELRNLPNQLTELFCVNQTLTDLGELPPSLIRLVVNQNHLQSLDLQATNHLVHLNVSDNKLQRLDNIPSTLQQLYCDYNYLQKLDLTAATQLEILHLKNNQVPVSILGLPTKSLKDFVREPNHIDGDSPGTDTNNINSERPDSADEQTAQTTQMTVWEAMNQYYKLKQAYLVSIRSEQYKLSTKQTTSALPICVVCQRKGGMIFESDPYNLIAKCGHATQPCSLYIHIEKGAVMNLPQYRDELHAQWMTIQQETIQMENDIRHGFLKDPTQSAQTLKTKLDQIQQNREKVEETAEKREHDNRTEMAETQQQAEMFFNSLRSDYEMYTKNPKVETLHEIVKLQIQQYQPCLDKLFYLQNASLMDKVKELHYPDADGEKMTYNPRYFYQDYALRQPKVAKFQKTAGS